jgi:hypothetical protein
MKHLAQIAIEFLKKAADWDKMSYEAQKEYLRKHPKSKKKLTKKPSQKSTERKSLEIDPKLVDAYIDEVTTAVYGDVASAPANIFLETETDKPISAKQIKRLMKLADTADFDVFWSQLNKTTGLSDKEAIESIQNVFEDRDEKVSFEEAKKILANPKIQKFWREAIKDNGESAIEELKHPIGE